MVEYRIKPCAMQILLSHRCRLRLILVIEMFLVHQYHVVVKDYFTQIDIRTDKEIKLYSKRAELLTTHPAGSYELVKDAKGQLTLKITNPSQFWSVSRYLVIQVK